MTAAPVNIRLLQRALQAFRFTTPLAQAEPAYIERPDDLGQQILNRVVNPTTHRLFLVGPVGCGKSTELIHLVPRAHADYTVVLCPCDRDIDLFNFDELLLIRYLLWRTLYIVQSELAGRITLTPTIVHDALRCIGTASVELSNPRLFFTTIGRAPHTDIKSVHQTFSALVTEIGRSFLPVLFIVDGLEKIPVAAETELRSFARSPLLSACQSVIVVPIWTLYGWETMEQYPDTELFRIAVSDDPTFVRDVVAARANAVMAPVALDACAAASGGVVRDGLQIASSACRRAIDERTSRQITPEHVIHGVNLLRQSFRSMISDDPARVRQFLSEVGSTGELPGDPTLRNRLLGNGMVLPNSDGRTFRVHPCVQ